MTMASIIGSCRRALEAGVLRLVLEAFASHHSFPASGGESPPVQLVLLRSAPLLQAFWGPTNRDYFMNIMNRPRALHLQAVCCRVERPRAHWRAAPRALARLWRATSAPLMRPVWQQACTAPILDIVGVAQHDRPRVGNGVRNGACLAITRWFVLHFSKSHLRSCSAVHNEGFQDSIPARESHPLHNIMQCELVRQGQH